MRHLRQNDCAVCKLLGTSLPMRVMPSKAPLTDPPIRPTRHHHKRRVVRIAARDGQMVLGSWADGSRIANVRDYRLREVEAEVGENNCGCHGSRKSARELSGYRIFGWMQHTFSPRPKHVRSPILSHRQSIRDAHAPKWQVHKGGRDGDSHSLFSE